MANITENQIKEIVERIVKDYHHKDESVPATGYTPTSYNGRKFVGIFSNMEDAINAANKGYQSIRNMSVEQREKIITEIRRLTRKEAQILAEIGVHETKMGRIEHKRLKHILVADKTPGTEDITSMAKTGDNGLTLIEMAPFGVVGSITPSTNPSETVICNSIGMIAAGNGVVFNPHPNAVCTSNYAVDLVNRA